MIEINDKSLCSGCYACSNICPKQCIDMKFDEEGFWYPVVNKDLCIDCDLCVKFCPIYNDNKQISEAIAYACYNRDNDIRMKSSSGGIFSLLAESVIKKGGVVYGAAFNEDFEVSHIKIDNIDNLEFLRGSKYVQSRIGKTFKEIRNLLNEGRLVYFSGTPCQIDGLICFLGKKYNNLICQDIICHGVPSPKVWKQYIKETGIKNIENIYFRNKNKGWKNFQLLIKSDEKVLEEEHGKNVYMQLFLKNYSLRPSCYNCKSKSLIRNCDITLADFWGIEKFNNKLDDDNGTSLVILYSEKGRELFSSNLDNIVFEPVDIDKVIRFNSAALESVDIPKKREFLFNNLSKKTLSRILHKLTKQTVIIKLKIFIYNCIHYFD